MTYLSMGKILEEIGKDKWKGYMRRGGQEIIFLHISV